MSLKLENNVLNNLEKHAEADYPNECCGFLFGKDGDQRVVTASRQTENKSDGHQRRRFQIDPKAYRDAEQFADENDLDFLGIYHSHPDHPAEPSEHDRAVAMPLFSYIIISVQKGKTDVIRSWRLNEERQFDEEFIVNERIDFLSEKWNQNH